MSAVTGRPATEGRLDLERKGLLLTVATICDEHGVTIDDVMGPSRRRSIARARHHAWYAIRGLTRMSYPEIGALFGRDHTSVMHGVDAHASRTPGDLEAEFVPERCGFNGMGEGAGI